MAKCELLDVSLEPIIYVTPEAMYKMEYYIDKSDKEIGWLGYVDTLGPNKFLIKDVFLLKQEVHSTTTEISPDALAEMANDLIAQGEEGINKYNTIRMWGHSHVNMATSPSSQDDNQMKEFATTGFYIRLIGNKKGEWNVSLWDFDKNILWTDVTLTEYYNVNINTEDLDKEIKDNVIEKVTTPTTYMQHGNKLTPMYSRYYDDDDYYNYGYGLGILPKKNESTSTNAEEDDEIINPPYEIEQDKISNEDMKEIKKWYSSDRNDCLFFATGELADIEDIIFQDYGVHLSPEELKKLQKEMMYIFDNKYGFNN